MNGNFPKKGRVTKRKSRYKTVHKTGKEKHYDKTKKEIYDSINARNRDTFAITSSNNLLSYGDEKITAALEKARHSTNNNTEDDLNWYIDFMSAMKKITEET